MLVYIQSRMFSFAYGNDEAVQYLRTNCCCLVLLTLTCCYRYVCNHRCFCCCSLMNQKEGLVQLLVAERTRVSTRPSTPNTPSQDRDENTRTSYGDWTPPPESWTEAKFGTGSGAARVTSEGTVLPMVRIRPRCDGRTLKIALY